MNEDEHIESLLRQAPKPEPGPQLSQRLRNSIPKSKRDHGSIMELSRSLWRRWLPAFAYAVLILGCVVVLAVQHHQGTVIQQQIDALRQEIADKQELIEQQQKDWEAEQASRRQLERLKADASEADELAKVLDDLRAQIAQLSLETERMETELAVQPELPDVIAPYDFFNGSDGPVAKAREQAKSIACINNLKNIGLAARIWANDNNDQYPPNLNVLSRELTSLKLLCCPADSASVELWVELSQLPDGGWSRWPMNGGSYDVFFSPEISDRTPNEVLARCRFHGHELYADGSVQKGRMEQAP